MALRFGLFVDGLLLVGSAALSTHCEPHSVIPVTNLSDGAEGSLRAAIATANRSAQSDVRIELPPGTFELTRCGVSDDTNANGDLDFTRKAHLTIAAPDGNVVIRQTCSGERVLDVTASLSRLSLSGVRITGGSLTVSGPSEVAEGGGVRAAGDVTLQATTITANAAQGADGSAAAIGQTPVPGGAARGGGLFVAGVFSADGASAISANSAIGGAGVNASDALPEPAGGGDAEGGGVYAGKAVTLGATVFAGNVARGGKGGDGTSPAAGGDARGGALAQTQLLAKTVTLAATRLTDNRAQGGDSGGYQTTVQAAPRGPAGNAEGGAIAATGAASGQAIHAANNQALGGSSGVSPTGQRRSPAAPGSARGGALATRAAASLSSVTFEHNLAASGDTDYFCSRSSCLGTNASLAAGGAVFAEADSLVSGTFSYNTAKRGVGGPSSEGLARGGAVTIQAALSVSGSFTGNAATGPTSEDDGVSARGGAISALFTDFQNGTLRENTAHGPGGAIEATELVLSNTTASQNRGSGAGGGVVYSASTVSVSNSTLRSNAVVSTMRSDQQVVAGGGAILAGGRVTLQDCWLEENTGRQTVTAPTGGRPGGPPLVVPGIFLGAAVRAAEIDAREVTFSDNQLRGHEVLPSMPPPIVRGISGGGAVAADVHAAFQNVTFAANKVLTGSPEWTPGYQLYVAPPRGSAVLAPNVSLELTTFIDNEGAAAIDAAALTTHRSVAIPFAGTTVCAPGVTSTLATYNWFADASCGLPGATNRQESAAFLLGALIDDGNGVPVREPERGSVLIDVVPSANCPVSYDARGVERPQGSACDIGAAEARQP